MPLALAQPSQSIHFEGWVAIAWVMDIIFGPYCPRKSLGRNDQNDSRPHRQFNKKPLELHHEEEKSRFHENPLRYSLPLSQASSSTRKPDTSKITNPPNTSSKSKPNSSQISTRTRKTYSKLRERLPNLLPSSTASRASRSTRRKSCLPKPNPFIR